jgi:FtsP/CotA-like multicopper oxidase with cupredoxin domain
MRLLAALALVPVAGAAIYRTPAGRVFGAPPAVAFHDNREPAGTLRDGVLRVTLRARLGRWRPDGDRRPEPLVVAAFATERGDPTIPGPLIRVRAGTRIVAHVVNDLPHGIPLVVHGLQTHPAAGIDTLRIAAGRARDVEFAAGEPGTYFYWATVNDTTTIEGRAGIDGQLTGAIVIDSAEGRGTADRVFVITQYLREADPVHGIAGAEAVAVNGRSWPFSERLRLTVGDTVHWRWVNVTIDNHPMHLHGFFYRVDARGSAERDTVYESDRRRLVVTERLNPGSTMAMTWAPSAAGNWLMHCHIHAHVAADSSSGIRRAQHAGHDAGTPMDDMAGLILGLEVSPGDAARAPAAGDSEGPLRRLRLTLGPSVLRPDGARVRLALQDSRGPVPDVGTPGPPIVLTVGERAEIVVRNALEEPTSVHWHGIELESYFDGVAGWSGAGSRLAPMIAPGDSFVVRMAPPRPGTFIYHAHALATTQVGDGLAGPLIVLGPGEAFEPTREIVWIVGGHDVDEAGFLRINGAARPPALTVESGRAYRVRIINITENNTGDVALLDGDAPVTWTPLFKDAAPLPAPYQVPGPARVRTSVGETHDFSWVPARRGTLRLEVRNTGRLVAEQQVTVR